MKKANKDGWIRHRGGKCPVGNNVEIVARLRSGSHTRAEEAPELRWDHRGTGGDIMAYRLHKPEEARHTEADPRVVEAKQAPKFDPVALRDEVKFLRIAIVAHQACISKTTARIEEIEIELDKEGFALVEKQDQKQALPDMADPDNWRAGDVIECIDAEIAPIGTKKTISKIEDAKIYRNNGGCVWVDAADEFWKFHSRP